MVLAHCALLANPLGGREESPDQQLGRRAKQRSVPSSCFLWGSRCDFSLGGFALSPVRQGVDVPDPGAQS